MSKSLLNQIYTSEDEAFRAFNKVQKELWKNLGVLWAGSKLDKVGFKHLSVAPIAALSGTMGLYQPETKEIEFPSVYLPIQALWRDLGVKANALDVIRHEFGHALADLYPEMLKKGGTFYKAFRGTYGPAPASGTDPKNWEGRCVSEYAATATQEDFAETFMLFVKHKGKIPAKFKRPVIVKHKGKNLTKFTKNPIEKKWDAVAEICRRVAACVE